MKCINRVRVLMNNPPAIHFSYKFEFLLDKPLTKTSIKWVIHSIVWSVFPEIVLNQRIHFAVLVLKSNFNFLGATMKSQKWSKRKAPGSNHTFKDGLAEHCTVCPYKCILKSFKFLAKNLGIHFTWTHCILIITF